MLRSSPSHETLRLPNDVDDDDDDDDDELNLHVKTRLVSGVCNLNISKRYKMTRWKLVG